MFSTVVLAETSRRVVVSKTLVETAKAISDMRGAFNVQDVLFALESQAVACDNEGRHGTAKEIRKITAQDVRSRLVYDNFTYRGRKPARWIWLEQKGDWFTWKNKSVEE